jgi:ABC-type multidrug transport system fused ATPase/permease subunit
LVFDCYSYAQQEAWLQSGTIKDNILFGRPENVGEYASTVAACALDIDFKGTLGDGDMTKVGEKGVRLSGGKYPELRKVC